MHRPRELQPAVVGGGTVACRTCGMGFLDLEAAGALLLQGDERVLSWTRMAKLEQMPTQPTFAAVRWTVTRGGAPLRRGRAA